MVYYDICNMFIALDSLLKLSSYSHALYSLSSSLLSLLSHALYFISRSLFSMIYDLSIIPSSSLVSNALYPDLEVRS